MKCDGLPDPVCVRELNTYLSLWKEDDRESLDSVLSRTLEVRKMLFTRISAMHTLLSKM